MPTRLPACFPYSPARALKLNLPANTRVDAEIVDRNGRAEAYVVRTRDRVLVNEALARGGWAQARKRAGPYEAQLRRAQEMAQAEGVGLWQACDGPPAEEFVAEFEQLESDFGIELTGRLGAAAEHDILDDAISGTVFAAPSAETGGTLSLLDIADGNTGGQEGFFDIFNPVVNALKKRAQKIIAKIVKLVRKAAKFAPCVPLVAKAVRSFAAKKYGTALKEALAAFSCIRSKA